MDSSPFQRLRYVRQLGHAFLVYPGATHNRFEHALGTYHLARRATTLLGERGHLAGVPADDIPLVHFAALLHDLGHYPFSHSLEEAGLLSHEALGVQQLRHSEIAGILTRTGVPRAVERVAELILGRSGSPLQGLISGSLDLDKIDYLTRDAHMCGVPYGNVDVDRLLDCLTLVKADRGGLTIGIHERGAAALESLLFAKYQMYRNVYWHHAVRSATAMFKRMVRTAIARKELDPEWIAQSTDEALMEKLRALPDAPLAQQLRQRRLYKRALELPSSELPEGSVDWIATDPDRAERAEDALAEELGLKAGDVLLDYPVKPAMLAVDLPVQRRDGSVDDVDLDLQRVAGALHDSARRFRVFVAEPRSVKADVILAVLEAR